MGERPVGADERAPATGAPPRRDVRRACIFVIDDDPSSRRVLGDLLASGPYEVHRFTSGEEALAALADTWPDVTLMDVVMPGLDGIETCRRMKALAGDRAFPIVVITGTERPADRLRGIEAGADDFLQKPVHAAELRARVANLVKVNAYHRLVREQRDAARAMATNLRGQVVEAERLATLGTFAASVCHELNNIATVLSATLELLERSAAPVDPATLGSLNHVSNHVQALARAVLKIARPQRPPAGAAVDLREIVRDVETMTRVTGRTRHVALEVIAPDGPLPVLVTSVHAQQVLLNLIVNAADALDGRHNPRLRIEIIPSAAHVACVVQDNGCGMTPDVLARVFEPFFTTKSSGTGTGLGMPVVQHLVDAWGGALAIQTAPGEGTTVRVTIPRKAT